MMHKVLLMLCSSALVSAGVIGTDYSPATSVSYSSISSPTFAKTVASPSSVHIGQSINAPIGYPKAIQSPPSYESILTTKESKYETPDGTQHSTFSKSFDTAYSSVNKLKPSKDGDVLANTIPGIYSTSVHSPIVYHHPQTTYTYSSPLVHTVSSPIYSKSISVPVTYASHNVPFSKTIVSPSITSYTTPIVSKTKVVTSGLSSYSTPLVHSVSAPTYTKSVSVPITYTTHDLPLTKTIVSPTITSYNSYFTPDLSKNKVTTSGLSSYSSHTPVFESQPIKTTVTYSEAPIVSHMSFSGLGTSYAW